MTHQTKECCERPRKAGAKFTGQDIKPDEIVKEIQLNYDAKKDRWNGYDPNMYMDVINEYEVLEEMKKDQSGKDQSNIDEEFKDKTFDNDAPIPNRDPKIKTTTRNLRLREDVAKYLLNLDENSAYYDAKSRSMRENPNPHLPADQ